MRGKSGLRPLLCSVLAAAMLCGCSGMTNPDDILRAPQLSGKYSAVQTALNSYLGESAQLKYPNNGEFLSPFLFGDWQGDGKEDAAVLFVSSGSANVQLAILEADDIGAWQVMDVADGLSDSVDTVSFADMQRSGGAQIIVGYATAGDKYLAAYDYSGGQLEAVLQQPYTQYLVQDLTGSGAEDLVLLSQDETGQTQIQLLTDNGTDFSLLPVTGLDTDRFSGYASLAAGQGAYGGNYLILDGYTGAAGNYLASVVLKYNAASAEMSTAVLPGTDDIYNASMRYATCLTSRDLDGDGVVEIPSQGEEPGTLNLTQTKRFSFVRWMDYTQTSPEKSFGILDEEYGYYLELPSEWEGNILMQEGAGDTIELCNLAGDVRYMSLRLIDRVGASAQWQRIGNVASMQIQVKLDPENTQVTAEELAASLYLL